jgi:hypothetical protein
LIQDHNKALNRAEGIRLLLAIHSKDGVPLVSTISMDRGIHRSLNVLHASPVKDRPLTTLHVTLRPRDINKQQLISPSQALILASGAINPRMGPTPFGNSMLEIVETRELLTADLHHRIANSINRAHMDEAKEGNLSQTRRR